MSEYNQQVMLLWGVYLFFVGMFVVFPWAVAFFTFARAKYVPTPPEKRLVKTIKHFADGHTEEIVSPTEEEACLPKRTITGFFPAWRMPMTEEILERRFTEMVARVQVRSLSSSRLASRSRSGRADINSKAVPRLDVRTDKKGEYFDITFNGDGEKADVKVVDVQPKDRHLLLLVDDGRTKSKFLCGHDERHWFVAAVPEKRTGVSNVKTAKEALQPAAVRDALAKNGVKEKDKLKRHNDGYHRQGEWFFIPRPDLTVPENLVIKNEPLSRGRGSKPHNMEFCYRSGGETVYVNWQYPNGISQARYNSLTPEQAARAAGG